MASDAEIDRFRLRELHVRFPEDQPIAWDKLPDEAHESWRRMYEENTK